MKSKIFFLITISLISLTLNAFSQVQVISESEYNKLIEKKELSNALVRTETTFSSSYKNGQIESKGKTISEYESSKRHHSIFYSLSNGKYENYYEKIYFDGREFQKNEDSEWKEIDRSNIPLIKVIENPNLKQFSKGNTAYKDKQVQFITKYTVSKYGNVLHFISEVDYLDQEDRLVFSGYYRSEIFAANVTYKSEKNYDYTKREIKIEIPEIKQTK